MESTRWKFQTTTPEAWEVALNACRDATVSIDFEQFIFCNDTIGSQFIEIFRAKARAGVRVRILCDAAGSFRFYGSQIIEELRRDGVEIVFFNPFYMWSPHNYTIWFFRDHRKLLIVDSNRGLTGGICISEYMASWRDTHIEITGPVVQQMKKAFDIMWLRAHKHIIRKEKNVDTASDFRFVTNSPRRAQRYLYKQLIETIHAAEKYVYLTTPYFIPNHRLLRVLKRAVRRGVDVKILIPHHSDHPIVDLASQSLFHTILKHGIKLYRYKPTMLHAKTAVTDGTWGTVGSLNLDNLSLHYNFEGNIVSTDQHFAQELYSHFMSDLEHSEHLTLKEWERRSMFQKILEALVRPFRKLF